MRIILIKKIGDFYEQPAYEHLKVSLQQWAYILKFRSYRSFAQILEDFGDVENKESLYIFNIEGGQYKIATSIFFDTECVYVEFIGTPSELEVFLKERKQNDTV